MNPIIVTKNQPTNKHKRTRETNEGVNKTGNEIINRNKQTHKQTNNERNKGSIKLKREPNY